jgi:hypothetical protein
MEPTWDTSFVLSYATSCRPTPPGLNHKPEIINPKTRTVNQEYRFVLDSETLSVQCSILSRPHEPQGSETYPKICPNIGPEIGFRSIRVANKHWSPPGGKFCLSCATSCRPTPSDLNHKPEILNPKTLTVNQAYRFVLDSETLSVQCSILSRPHEPQCSETDNNIGSEIRPEIGFRSVRVANKHWSPPGIPVLS